MIIALTTTSRSRSAKISAALRKELNDSTTLMAGFRYPACRVAKMLGWDERYDERGRKLVSAIYNAALEYDRNYFINKMEKLINKSSKRKQTIIITDLDDVRQVQMLKRMDSLQLIICGSHSALHREGLIDIYIDSERPVEEVVQEIIGSL